MNPWILTASGRAFDLVEPTAAMVDPVDIAHSLSRQCRWKGHTKLYYSVAEHCVRVSELVASALALAELDQTGEEARLLTLAALVHDGHEAIIGDVSTPVKRLIGAAWAHLEERIDAAIGARFSLDPALMRHPLVKRADAILLATEARDLMPEPPREWLPADLRPLPTRIEPWTAHEARERFLRALGGLRP